MIHTRNMHTTEGKLRQFLAANPKADHADTALATAVLDAVRKLSTLPLDDGIVTISLGRRGVPMTIELDRVGIELSTWITAGEEIAGFMRPCGGEESLVRIGSLLMRLSQRPLKDSEATARLVLRIIRLDDPAAMVRWTKRWTKAIHDDVASSYVSALPVQLSTRAMVRALASRGPQGACRERRQPSRN